MLFALYVVMIGLQMVQFSLAGHLRIVNIHKLPSDVKSDDVLIDDHHPHIQQLVNMIMSPYTHLVDLKFDDEETHLPFLEAIDNQPDEKKKELIKTFGEKYEDEKVCRREVSGMIEKLVKHDLEKLGLLEARHSNKAGSIGVKHGFSTNKDKKDKKSSKKDDKSDDKKTKTKVKLLKLTNKNTL